MKKTLTALLLAPLLFACNNNNNEEKQTDQKEIATTKDNGTVTNTVTDNTTFDINSIPLSTADIGVFPFFTAPEGAQYINKPKVMDFDFIVFVTPDSIYEIEGKTFRAHVHPDRKSETEISGRFLIKSFEDAILKAGGVKVFEGKLQNERKDKYAKLCTYAGSNGSIDIWNNDIATYVIRRNDGNIYIALDKGNSNTTSIQIVQEKPFEQTIQKITSDNIEKDLNTSGKAVLYINFDTDKATLKQDGLATVQEIFKVLERNKDLKIAINGYTDNAGNKEHNLKLSENRAASVKTEITKLGISADRLTSRGFGQDNPIAGNDTEAGKAQNRRVELIKL